MSAAVAHCRPCLLRPDSTKCQQQQSRRGRAAAAQQQQQQQQQQATHQAAVSTQARVSAPSRRWPSGHCASGGEAHSAAHEPQAMRSSANCPGCSSCQPLCLLANRACTHIPCPANCPPNTHCHLGQPTRMLAHGCTYCLQSSRLNPSPQPSHACGINTLRLLPC